MRSKFESFVQNKCFDDLSSVFSLRVGRSYRIDVFIWKSTDGLYANTYWPKRNYLGAYVGNPNRNGRGLWAEIHLIIPMIGAGYVAHEIAHLVFDWFNERGYRDEHGDWCVRHSAEDVAHLTGRLNANFWGRFYDRYQVVEGKINVPDSQ